jgi:hypothetical protein
MIRAHAVAAPAPPLPQPTVVSVAVSPAGASVQTGLTLQYVAVSTWSDGTIRQLTGSQIWSCTGGSISGSGLFTAGPAGAGSVTITVGLTTGTTPVTITATPPPPAPTLVTLLVLPAGISVQTGLTQQYTATGVYSDNSTQALTTSVAWSCTRGSITSGGLFTAGSVGPATVSAILGSVVGTTSLSITGTPPPPPPPSGSYVAFQSKDWSTYADKATLAATGILGVYDQQHTLQQPVLPVTDFWDLVSDPIFGKVVRGNGGLNLNPYPVIVEALNSGVAGNSIVENFRNGVLIVKNDPVSPTITETFSGLTRANFIQAVNVGGIAPVGQANGQPSALIRQTGGMNTGVGALPSQQLNVFNALSGGAVGVKARFQFGDNVQGRVLSHTIGFGSGNGKSHIWARQFLRFSTNYTTEGLVGGEGSSSDKLMFFLHLLGGGREYFVADGVRFQLYSFDTSAQGTPQSPTPGTLASSGQLAITNTVAFNPNAGQNLPDLFPMFSVRCAPGLGSPCGPGDGEWYECIMHHQAVGTRCEGTFYFRRYTTGVGTTVSPGAWHITGQYKVLAAGQTWTPIQNYQMGVNRNRQWDSTMYRYWGPYELVDGTLYPNPWGVVVP